MIVQDIDTVTGTHINTLRMLWIEVPRRQPARKKKYPGWSVIVARYADYEPRESGFPEECGLSISLTTIWAIRRASSPGAWSWDSLRPEGGTHTTERFQLPDRDLEAYLAGNEGKVTGPWREVSMHDAVVLQHMLRAAIVRYVEFMRTSDVHVLEAGDGEVVVP